MSRSLFGAWGASLPHERFAKAIAAVAALGLRKDALAEQAVIDAARVMRSAGQDAVVLRLQYLAQLVDAIARRSAGVRAAEEFLAAWERLAHWWDDSGAERKVCLAASPATRLLRFELDPAVASELRQSVPDVLWLINLLLGSGDGFASAAYVRVDEPDRPVVREWPLRVGMFGDARSSDLAEQLSVGQRASLVRWVDLERSDEDCDLLLLPDDLRQGLVRVLLQPRRLRADCVLLIGGAGVAAERIMPLAGAMRSEVLTGGVAILHIDFDHQGEWFAGLIEQLAQGLPLDVALLRAGQAVQQAEAVGPPLLIASRRLANSARVAASAGCEGERLRGLVTTSTAQPRGAQESPAHDQRRVNFSLMDVSGAAAPTRVEDRLVADRAYQIALNIGLPRAETEAASDVFPSERLPQASDGHWLDVFFVPLVRTASGRLHTPQQGRLFLPPHGDSLPCSFSFRTHGVRDEYRARILITHENRVIQTLVFSSPLGPADRRFALEVENVVSPGFEPSWHGQPFDAAIVVNHDRTGQAGFTTVVGTEVSFREPLGIDRLVSEVKALLSAEATFPAPRGTLDDSALLKLFDDLARYGRAILKPMPTELQGRVPEGARIQIVEARSGAWLPVEILYSSPLPKAAAQLCPNARAALLGEASHASCAHRDDRQYLCPLRFWGFSCVIERQPSLTPPAGADYTISVPQPGANHLDVFKSVLVGASSKVRAQDLTDPGGIIDAVRRVATSARTVKDWDEWESAVEADSPSLLLLLPHSQEDPAHPGISGLEIGGVLLTYPELESTYVTGPAASTPVVLLLGCSTQLTDVPFLNFVEAFKREQAALVIGTLATIRGRRAVAFVGELLDGLKAAAGSQRTFGEVFLQTKRRLLAGGDGFVLSLTAYGDVGWRL
jgi:hypothetical protein